MSAELRAGADRIVAQANDVKWQVLRGLIEEYGREMYNLGAQRLMERLHKEAAEDPCLCAVCHPPLEQADGSPDIPTADEVYGILSRPENG